MDACPALLATASVRHYGAENVGKHETAHRLEPMSYNESTQVILRAHANLYQHKDDIIVFMRTLYMALRPNESSLAIKGLELYTMV